jgi:hypothetical protein
MQRTLISIEVRRILLDKGLQLVVNQSVQGAENIVRGSIRVSRIFGDRLRKIKAEMDKIIEDAESYNFDEEVAEMTQGKAREGDTQVKDHCLDEGRKTDEKKA